MIEWELVLASATGQRFAGEAGDGLIQGDHHAQPSKREEKLANLDGRFLRLSECLDNVEFAEVAEICDELSLSARDLWRFQRSAFDWVTQMA